MFGARLAAAVALCVVLGTSVLHAQAPASGAELLARGKQALIDRDAEKARAAFEAGLTVADGTEQRWRMMLGLALALELEGGRLAAAYAYRRFLDESLDASLAKAEPWSGRRRRVLRDVERLEADILVEHARFDLQSEPPGARVVIDGRVSELFTPAVVYVSSGKHELRLEHDGFHAERLSLTVERGQRALLHRKLVALPVPSPAPTVAPPPPTVASNTPEAAPELFAPGLVILAGGVATLVVAGALHWTAIRDAEEVRALGASSANIPRDEQLRARIADYQVGYATCYGIGGGLAAAGVAMLIYDAVVGDAATVGWIGPTPDGAAWGLSTAW